MPRRSGQEGDGALSVEDFVPAKPASRAAYARWEAFRSEFDADGNGVISPEEFIGKFKSMALRRPLDGDCFATVPSTSLATLSSLNRSINATIRSLCTLFYASVAAAPAGPPSPPSDFWTQHPDAATFGMQRLYLQEETKQMLESLFGALDTDHDALLTAADFALNKPFSRSAAAKWEILRAQFDLNGNGKITPEEFISGFKSLAMRQPLERGAFPSLPRDHRECMQLLNRAVNKVILQLGKALQQSLAAS
uniref:EF-hand domain-containing protein n=1 Tax=Chrysotila carterae TaxID=13221 RepID=A0A7S4B2X6_CHRCT